MSFSIIGLAGAVPERTIANDAFSAWLDTGDEWIRSHTGIERRHIMADGDMLRLSAQAAKAALAMAATPPEALDLILCATIQGENMSPALACQVQGAIGATCPAMDINAACSGFVYALDVADAYFKSGKVRHALVLGMERLSAMADWSDRATCVLFGDGGGAVVLGPGDGLKSILTTCKSNAEALFIPASRTAFPMDGIDAVGAGSVHMNGQEVYKFAVNAMARDVRQAIADAELTEADIDWVVPHQANLRIIRAAGSRLSIPEDRYVLTIAEYGNTSAGSIPLALSTLNSQGKLKRGQHIVLTAFGGGLTSAACVIRWDIDSM